MSLLHSEQYYGQKNMKNPDQRRKLCCDPDFLSSSALLTMFGNVRSVTAAL